MPSGLILAGYILMIGGACGLFLFRSWIRMLTALAVQSLGFGLVALQISSPPIAVAKILAGWIAVSLLGVTVMRDTRPFRDEDSRPISSIFRFSLLLFLFSSIVSLLPQLSGVFRDPPRGIAFAACFLIGAGLVNIGLAEPPLRAAISLLTIFQGFELGYLWIEQSLLVLALLAATDLATILILVIHHSFAPPSAKDRALP